MHIKRNTKQYSDYQFRYRGANQKTRDIYFQKRSKEREKEILELERDVDYLIGELQRLQRRTKTINLISTQLEYMSIRLSYLLLRKHYNSDAAIIRYLSERYHMSPSGIIVRVFRDDIANCYYLTETEAGKEVDAYIPFELAASPITEPLIDNKLMQKKTKAELIEFIVNLSKQTNHQEREVQRIKFKRLKKE